MRVKNTLMIIDPSMMTVSSASPQVVDHTKTETVSVSGTGFVDTQQIACLFVVSGQNDGKSKSIGPKMTASYVSATEVFNNVIFFCFRLLFFTVVESLWLNSWQNDQLLCL